MEPTETFKIILTILKIQPEQRVRIINATPNNFYTTNTKTKNLKLGQRVRIVNYIRDENGICGTLLRIHKNYSFIALEDDKSNLYKRSLKNVRRITH